MSADLIERLEKATGPSREIDALLWLRWGWRDVRDVNRNSVTDILAPTDQIMGSTLAQALERWPNDIEGSARNWNIPRLTASLDAAVSLVERVLPEWGYFMRHDKDSGYVAALVYPDAIRVTPGAANGASMPLALCLALLRAKAAE